MESRIGVADSVSTVGVDVAIISAIGPCWMDTISEFLADNRVLDDEREANKVGRVAARYWLSADRKLYRRSYRGPYLSCLHPEKINELLSELHDEVCGSHVGGRSLAHQVMTQGFWWLQMQKDATDYVHKCERCQKHAPLIHQPAGVLNPVNSLWPFAQ